MLYSTVSTPHWDTLDRTQDTTGGLTPPTGHWTWQSPD
ncbi:hypothetical protein E2C01_030134 [Portunus trituberculatus]|uniref:Uncharacterized protein n=1 Tax=Portunus trituberculatus TaxID=210409 RepID=A0A5B7ETY1_PORTR|nr:hypothetical protein [Portunus trituberculatus]